MVFEVIVASNPNPAFFLAFAARRASSAPPPGPVTRVGSEDPDVASVVVPHAGHMVATIFVFPIDDLAVNCVEVVNNGNPRVFFVCVSTTAPPGCSVGRQAV